MSRSVANVDVTTETFGAWVIRTNTLLDALSNEIITANSTYANTGTPGSQRNAQLFGAFGANTFVVYTSLTGGSNTTSYANLNITSNTIITGSTVVVGSNTTFTGNNFTLSSNVTSFNGNTINVSANTTFSNKLVTANTSIATFNGAVEVNNTASFSNTYLIEVISNTNIGTNASDRLIYSFPKATYTTGKLVISATRTGNNQIAEALIAHDGTNAYLTVYGTVSSPLSGNNAAPLGTYNVSINNANVEIKMTQTASNTAVKVAAHLFK